MHPPQTERHCRKCGCTEFNACQDESGPCWWIEVDLCSHCAEPRPATLPPRVRLIDASPVNACDVADLSNRAAAILDPSIRTDGEIINVLLLNQFNTQQIAKIWAALMLRQAMRFGDVA